MKRFFGFILISSSALAGNIPLELFDQSKLETIVRRIPSALEKIENHNGYRRKHYLFPSHTEAPFTLKCYADYYGNASIPSEKVCEVDVPGQPDVGDEYLINIRNPKTVSELFNAISFGPDVKKSFSNELVYGQAHDGSYRNLFRYSIICKPDSCQITFSPKAAYL